MRQQNLVESANTMIHMYELLLAHGSDINVKNSYGIPVPLQVIQITMHFEINTFFQYELPNSFL